MCSLLLADTAGTFRRRIRKEDLKKKFMDLTDKKYSNYINLVQMAAIMDMYNNVEKALAGIDYPKSKQDLVLKELAFGFDYFPKTSNYFPPWKY